MNRDTLKLFFIVILSFVTLDQKCSDDQKYFEFLPEGKIREYCEKFPEASDSRFIARVIWSAVNEDEYRSMTKAEKLAYENISRFFLNEHTITEKVLYDWKKNDYRLLATIAFEITLKMNLPVEKSHKEIAKVIEMCMQLEKKLKKASRARAPLLVLR